MPNDVATLTWKRFGRIKIECPGGGGFGIMNDTAYERAQTLWPFFSSPSSSLFFLCFGSERSFFLFHSTFQAHGTQACGISEIGAYTLMHIAFASTFFMALSFSKPNPVFLFVMRPETQRAYKMTVSLVRIPFCILYVLQQKDSFHTAHLPEAEQLRYDTDR